MLSRTLMLIGFAFVGASSPALVPARAQMTRIEAGWVDQGCGYGSYRAPNGSCDIVKDPNWRCQPGLHEVPTFNGYRCVQNGY
jgi:hypothetical protein